MKIILLVMAMLSVLLTTGCNKNEPENYIIEQQEINEESDQTNSAFNNETITEEKSNFSINDLYGKWYISSAVNGKTAEKENDVEKIIGEQYSSKELFLELNSDGTFNDNFVKLINNDLANNGTYEFLESYNRVGDSRVVLTYADGNNKLTTIMYFDSNLSTPYIGYGFINDYDVYLKKMP